MKESKYNATVVGKILLTPDIMTLRVDTDEPREEFSDPFWSPYLYSIV